MEGILSLRWNNHISVLCQTLASLHKKELYSDVTLACGGRFFPVHKLVLCACSRFFQDLFSQTTCSHPVVILKDITTSDLEALLSYMYLGEANVAQTDLSRLIKAAECLSIKGLAVSDERSDAGKRGRVDDPVDAADTKRRRNERSERRDGRENERNERNERSERRDGRENERNERSERNERNERSERNERNERRDVQESERSERRERRERRDIRDARDETQDRSCDSDTERSENDVTLDDAKLKDVNITPASSSSSSSVPLPPPPSSLRVEGERSQSSIVSTASTSSSAAAAAAAAASTSSSSSSSSSRPPLHSPKEDTGGFIEEDIAEVVIEEHPIIKEEEPEPRCEEDVQEIINRGRRRREREDGRGDRGDGRGDRGDGRGDGRDGRGERGDRDDRRDRRDRRDREEDEGRETKHEVTRGGRGRGGEEEDDSDSDSDSVTQVGASLNFASSIKHEGEVDGGATMGLFAPLAAAAAAAAASHPVAGVLQELMVPALVGTPEVSGGWGDSMGGFPPLEPITSEDSRSPHPLEYLGGGGGGGGSSGSLVEEAAAAAAVTLSCPYCQRTFTYRSDLNRHIRSHTGEKPYTCRHCDHRASQKSHLNEHIKRRHPHLT